jgi:hypothetical protein
MLFVLVFSFTRYLGKEVQGRKEEMTAEKRDVQNVLTWFSLAHWLLEKIATTNVPS